MKLPILSWLPSSSQIPLSYLFKAKSQHHQQQQHQHHHQHQHQHHQQQQQNQDSKKNSKQYYYYQQQPQLQTTNYVPASFSLPNLNTKPVYIYTPGYTHEITNSANSGPASTSGSTGNYYIQTTPFVSNDFIKTYAQWLDNNKNVQQSQVSVDQPRPIQYTTTTWNRENSVNQIQFPKQTNQVVQDYKFVPSSYIETDNVASSLTNSLPSSQTSSVSQIDSNQDLGGWESIQLPDVVSPGASTSGANNAADNIEQDSQTILTAATSPNELMMNETNVHQQSSSQQSSPGQSQSHRIVYQSMASNPVMTAVPLNSTKTVSSASRSFAFNQQAYSPIYQLLQTSVPFQQQSQPQTSSSTGSNTNSILSSPQWTQQPQQQTNFTQNL